MITVKSIVYKPTGERENKDQVGYLRVSISEANLIAGYGIENDRKGGSPNRQLNVMDAITLAELAGEGYPTEPGRLGENIIISGIDLRTVASGTHLKIGDEAVIAVRKLREPCEQLTELDERMPDSVIDRVGYMCRVVVSGRIKVGDSVTITEAITEHAAK